MLWLAIWLLPSQSKYGGWPRSGEIDLMESRGNVDYANSNGIQIGVKRITSTLHFGPNLNLDKWHTTTFAKNNNRNGFDHGFHRYEFLWNEKEIRFFVDGIDIGSIQVDDGFWKRGDFDGENIWASGTKMAPFDKEVCRTYNKNKCIN